MAGMMKREKACFFGPCFVVSQSRKEGEAPILSAGSEWIWEASRKLGKIIT